MPFHISRDPLRLYLCPECFRFFVKHGYVTMVGWNIVQIIGKRLRLQKLKIEGFMSNAKILPKVFIITPRCRSLISPR